MTISEIAHRAFALPPGEPLRVTAAEFALLLQERKRWRPEEPVAPSSPHTWTFLNRAVIVSDEEQR